MRVAGSCGGKATSKLRLRARDGAIELEFELEHSRARAAWRVAIVHERRVVWRGAAGVRLGAAFARRRLPNLAGTDPSPSPRGGPRDQPAG